MFPSRSAVQKYTVPPQSGERAPPPPSAGAAHLRSRPPATSSTRAARVLTPTRPRLLPEVAAAAIRALRSRDCAVPEAVAVMGFDDIPICEMVDPAITTVHTHKEQLGSEAVSLLYRRIVAGETAQSIRSHGCIKLALSTRIVVRGSTGPLDRC